MTYRIPVKVTFKDGTTSTITSWQESPDINVAIEAARQAATSQSPDILWVDLAYKMLPDENGLWVAGNCYGYTNDEGEHSLAYLKLDEAREACAQWLNSP